MKKNISWGCAVLLCLVSLPLAAYVLGGSDSDNDASIQYSVPIVRDRANFVYYYDHGAAGDGVTCDFAAIIRAHDVANRLNKPVRADYGKTYLISGKNQSAIIQTDTDWRNATFIIDDRNLENRRSNVFRVRSRHRVQSLGDSVTSLTRGQANLGRTFAHNSLVIVENANVRKFIRRGRNENAGHFQAEVFLVDTDGNIDPSTPILWDYEQITSSSIRPIDDEQLVIKGGRFITIPHELCPQGLYQWRSIQVERSNTLICGLRHYIVDDDNASPYWGFVHMVEAANITIQNSYFTGRRRTLHGSYGISARRVANLLLYNVRQTNDINDTNYWGIFASNESKNITFDRVMLSRVGAHRGVHNATIRNSTLGHHGIPIIGSGLLLIENTIISGNRFINLRPDFGSTWSGEIIIRNSTFHPSGNTAQIIDGNNDGLWNFGYQAYLPTVIIDGLHITDERLGRNDNALRLFGRFEQARDARFPIMFPKKIFIYNLTRDSGYGFVISLNTSGKFDNVLIATY